MPRHSHSRRDRSQGGNEPNRRYHDRVASRYDSIYEDPFWDFHDRITWNHIKPFLPAATGANTMDLGCGTGKWGLKLLKAGYAVTFTDLSNNMLQEVRKKLESWGPDLAAKAARATIQQSDAVDLRAFAESSYELITAMGDVVSICSDPAACLSEMRRLLKPGGVTVFTVDNYLAAIDHFIESVIKLVFVERSRKRMLGGNPCHGASSNRIAFDEEAIGELHGNTQSQLMM